MTDDPIVALVDTHAHLNDRAFESDLGAVVGRARDAGVRPIINVGYSLESTFRAIDLAEKHSDLYATVGLHPHDASDCTPELIDDFRRMARHPKVVAVGETGLDFYRDLSPRDKQVEALKRLVDLAREVELPLIIHDREAHDEVLSVLEAEGAAEAGGVFHCYSGGIEYLARALDLGFSIGIDGPVTYARAEDLRHVAATVPLERLLLETDCPWLTPKGHGRDRNEPAFLVDIAERVGQVRGMRVGAVARATRDNALRAFPKMGEG